MLCIDDCDLYGLYFSVVRVIPPLSFIHVVFNLEDPIDVWYVYLNLLVSKTLALCLPPNIWVSSHAPLRRQAPNIWVSQRLFGHPGLGQDPRACVGKVLRTFAHIAPLCYASYLDKSLLRI
jgi:hypothetical protein